jgi:hypothetical protein
MSKYFFFLSLIFIGLTFACDKQTLEEIDPDLGYEYFPLEVGKYLEYEADSIIYDPSAGGTEVLVSKTLVREEIIDTLRSNAGDLRFIVERSERADSTQAWEVKRQLWLSRAETQAIRNEDNLQFISMVFPIKQGVEWNGNLFFDESLIIPVAGESIEMFKSWSYEFRRHGESFNEEGLSFPDVVEVSMADNENLIERRFAREIYARDIGLVYRELLILDTQCEVCCNNDFALCESLPWEQKAEKGFILRQRITDYN